jgi:uncharacterized membrane protein YidH (DUF202 family)
MFEKFSRHRVVTALCSLAFAVAIGGFVWAILELRGITGNPLILHFNDVDGITRVGGLDNIIFIGILEFVIIGMNSFIAMEFDARDHFFGKFLAGVTLIFAILLFIGFAAIINVNV